MCVVKYLAESFALSFFLFIFADVLHINRTGSMTTVELRTSITADLELLSAEMLENVSRYVKRLTRHSRNAGIERQKASKKMEDAMSFVKTLSVIGEQKVPGDERGIDALVNEKYSN